MKFKLDLFFGLAWLVTLFVMRQLLPAPAFCDAYTSIYTVLLYGSYAAIYLAPWFICAWVLQRFAKAGKTAATVAIIGSGLTIVLLFVDARIHSLYGFHINGFVVNLVLTPGGLDSLGADAGSNLAAGMIMIGLMLVPVGLWFVSQHSFWSRLRIPRVLLVSVVAFASASITERVMYGMADLAGRSEPLMVADSLPLHLRMTFRKLGKQFGMIRTKRQNFSPKTSGRITYPSQPLRIVAPARPLNVIWLVAESLRADMLDPEIMPATWGYAQKGVRYTRHFSGGNGTRMGVFSMFSGLTGSYWFSFLNEGRGAAVIDVLSEASYDMHLSTAQSFTYPEFGQTIFSRVPHDRLHVEGEGEGYERDQRNVARMLKTLEGRDSKKPFFMFNFFESPHARYHFPPEAVIRPDYLKEFNYARMDKVALKREIIGIRARYINAVHALDMNLAPLWRYLEEHHLRDNTVIIFTGDHGEEFMEKGRWGHNSEFVNEQVQTPMVLWAPGNTPAVDSRLSAHMDLTATLMPLLGVQNPASDYSLGFDLLKPPSRPYTIVSDWDRVAYVDEDIKFTIAMSASGFFQPRVTDFNDQPLNDPDSLLQSKQKQLLQVMKDVSRFYGEATANAKAD